MLQFDNSCYVDAKQYHLASFSTCNSMLNTSLRKPIRMQDFIQLCDSILYISLYFTVAGMFNTASPVNSSQSANNNARTTQQVETGDIITLKPNKQRTKGKKNKLPCSLL